VLEKREGGRVSFKFLRSDENNLDKDHEMNGKIIKFIPNRELSYTWHFRTKPEFSKDTIVTTMMHGVLASSSNNHLLYVISIVENRWKVTKHESYI